MKPEYFFEIVQSPSDFTFLGINLLRLFYARFIAFVSGQDEWVMKPQMRLSLRVIILSLLRMPGKIFKLLVARFGQEDGKIIFYGAPGRLSRINGITYDLYNANIIDKASRDHFLIYQDANDVPDKVYSPDFVRQDFIGLFKFCHLVVRFLLYYKITRFSDRILNKYPELRFNRRLITQIVTAFYSDYLSYSILLRLIHPSKVLLICHYSKGSFIAACKKLNIPVIELMHGQINRTHAFYDFPRHGTDPSDRVLLPDRLVVYGEYWRQILIEKNFLPEQDIVVGGYYLKLPEVVLNHTDGRKKVILLTTQPTVQKELLAYCRFIKENLDRSAWQFVIRPHPSEDSQAYNTFVESDFITVSFDNTYQLLNNADVHISAYSTVLYEAVRYPICNYALFVARAEHRWRDVIGSGVARPLMPDELPSIYEPTTEQAFYYFDHFKPDVFLS